MEIPALSDLLVADVAVLCLDESGTATVPLPAALHAGDATVSAAPTALELLEEASYPIAIAVFIRARTDGYGSAIVNGVDGARKRIHIFDEMTRWQCFVVVLSSSDGDSNEVVSAPIEVPVRRTTSRMDATGHTIDVDDGFTRVLGWTREEYEGKSSLIMLHPDDYDRAMRAFAELLTLPGGQTRTRQRVRHSDGHWLWLEITHTNLLHTDDPHVLAESVDISGEMEVTLALQEREALLALLTEALPVGVLHLRTDGSPDIANSSWSRLTGTADGAGVDDFLENLVDGQAVAEAIESARQDAVVSELQVQIDKSAVACRHGQLGVRVLPGTDAPHQVLLTLTDTTQAVEFQAELSKLARNDHLTEVLNRFGIEELLGNLLKVRDGASPTAEPLTVLYFDLNRFKTVNDTHGHAVGDMVLAKTADLLRRQLRPTDAVGRLGGDEFLAVIRNVNSEETQRLLKRIERSLDELSAGFEEMVHVSVAIGVAVAQPGDDFDSLVGRADADMYSRKLQGAAD